MMDSTDPPPNPFNPNNDDENPNESSSSNEEEATGLIAPSSPTPEKDTANLTSYKQYLTDIASELPPTASARAALDPDEEITLDGVQDPPEENVPLTLKRGPFRKLREKRWRRKQSKRDTNQVVFEEDDELEEMYQEMGIAPPVREKRYTHPACHSSLFICVLVSLIVGVLVSIIVAVLVSHKEEGETLGEEVVKILAGEEDKLHDFLHGGEQEGEKEGDGTEGMSEAEKESMAYESVTELYKPTWFHRGDGEDGWDGQSYDEAILFCAGVGRILCPYEAYCPLGPSTTPLGGGQQMPQSWAPLIDYEDGWVQIGQTGQCKQWKDMYTVEPAWGETGAGSEIITEHIMCCLPHQLDGKQHPPPPDTTTDLGSISPPEEVDFNWEQTLYENLGDREYSVAWYSRSTGWKGTSHNDAMKFCAVKETILCPFESVCPNGPDNNPYGGEKQPPHGGTAWVPIISREDNNEWVAASKPNLCIKYMNIHGENPEWGRHGGNEAETENIACCKVIEGSGGGGGGPASNSGDAEAKPSPDVASVAVDTQTPTPQPTTQAPTTEAITPAPTTTSPTMEPTTMEPTTKPTTVGPTNQPTTASPTPPPTPDAPTSSAPTSAAQGKANEMLYQAIASIHGPVWFDRSTGWKGQTWQEAKEFCLNQAGGGNTAMQLCQLGAYCPLPHEHPMQGPREAPTDDENGRGAWSPFGNMENAWVRVDGTQSCNVYNSVYGEKPAWGMTGEGAEAITRNVLCCKSTLTSTTSPPTNPPSKIEIAAPSDPVASPITPSPVNQPTDKPTNDKLVASTFSKTDDKYTPYWFDRKSWKGTAYTDAIEFCAERGWVLCPYEAYCPLGPGKHLYGGVKAVPSSWAPLIDVPNGWVQVGSVDTCELYNALHPHPPLWGLNGSGDSDLVGHIMCCNNDFTTAAEAIDMANKAPVYDTPNNKEQFALNNYHPVWFQRKHGYSGSTYEESIDFCKHVADMELCPLNAYCPNGETSSLFYGMDAFAGEQWAPIKTSDSSIDWVQIGTADDASTCKTYSKIFNKPTPWADDGSQREKKQHILCCQKEIFVTDPESGDEMTMDAVMSQQMNPTWYDASHGWNGGSHNDAQLFCSASGKKELCPFIAICPSGKGMSAIGGHKVDFVAEGEQWAPVGGLDDHWVQIGQLYENLATTCMSFQELTGQDRPSWGVDADNEPDKKKYILCCDKRQS